MKFPRFFGPLALISLALACGWGLAGALVDDARADDAADAARNDSEGKDAKAKKDLFAIPDGGAREILAYMRELRDVSAEGDNEQEQAEFAEKVLRTMITAADRLLAAKPSGVQASEGYQYKMMAWQLLSQLGDKNAEKQFLKTIDAAKADSRSEVAALGWQSAIQIQSSQWGELSAGKQKAFKKEILDKVADGEPEALDVSIVRAVADSLAGVDDAFVVDLVSQAIPKLKDSKDKQVRQRYAKANLEGLVRRLNLLGNPIEITGTLLDGKPVDWKSYRGKVVLVDFWATWCGPCRGEVPNVLAMYKAYHDKGFDVLGVSLDQTPEDAHKYIEEMQLPWPSIFPENEKDRVWQNPLVKHYDVTGIPMAILVGKDGKVVHLEARGEVLREQLQQLLGDPLEAKESDAAADEPASG